MSWMGEKMQNDLTSIELENFKSFGKRIIVPIKPITLLYGPNSSGKSSIIQPLLAMKQTLDDRTIKGDILQTVRGTLVDLGEYENFVFSHQRDNNFKFRLNFQMDLSKTSELRKRFSPLSSSQRWEEFILYPRVSTGLFSLKGVSIHDEKLHKPLTGFISGKLKGCGRKIIEGMKNGEYNIVTLLVDQFLRAKFLYYKENGFDQKVLEIIDWRFRKYFINKLTNKENEKLLKIFQKSNRKLEKKFCMDWKEPTLGMHTFGCETTFTNEQIELDEVGIAGWQIYLDGIDEPFYRIHPVLESDSDTQERNPLYNVLINKEHSYWKAVWRNFLSYPELVNGEELFEKTKELWSMEDNERSRRDGYGVFLEIRKVVLKSEKDPKDWFLEEFRSFKTYDNFIRFIEEMAPFIQLDRAKFVFDKLDVLQWMRPRKKSFSSLENPTTMFPGLLQILLYISHMKSMTGSIRERPMDSLVWNSIPFSDFYFPIIRNSLELLQSEVYSLFKKVLYIGANREMPDRGTQPKTSPNNVGKVGKFWPSILLNKPNSKFVDKINKELKRMDVGYELKAEEDKKKVIFIDARTKIESDVNDLGFGISQIMPIIVQSLIVKPEKRDQVKGSLIIIEQPESQIHPRLQTELGTLFANTIKGPWHNRYIIETHSEHLILRIQRLIREGELSKDDVAVMYVDKGEEGSICEELRMNRKGEFIDEWPDGFFEDGFKEIF